MKMLTTRWGPTPRGLQTDQRSAPGALWTGAKGHVQNEKTGKTGIFSPSLHGFRGLQPTSPSPLPPPRSATTPAQPVISFHGVKWPPPCQSPQRARPAAGIAPHRWFALFREARRVGGRGISDFYQHYFWSKPIFSKPCYTPQKKPAFAGAFRISLRGILQFHR